MEAPPKVDLAKLEPGRLRSLMSRYKEHGYDDLARACLTELESRGAASRADFSHLRWNRETVNTALKPFVAVAKAVEGNLRTPFTEAGGTKIGKAKDDPGRNWIDTYSAVKRGDVNALFVCYVKVPGDDPDFQIHVDGKVQATFNADQLDEALRVWRDIAARA